MMSLLPSIALRQLHLDHRRGGVGGFDQYRRPCGFGCSRSDAQPSVSFRMFTAQAIAYRPSVTEGAGDSPPAPLAETMVRFLLS